MTERIDTAAVLGAGVMGSAIAAHLAGAGVKTHLLDIVPPNLTEAEKKDPGARSRFAISGIDKALKQKPAAFYDPDAARLVTPGNFEDHLERLKDCDLVIEAVLEKLDVKQAIWTRVGKVVRPDVILASNTSGLSIAKMTEVLPAALQKRFVVMHFFNPVRYMRLLEIVPGPKTDAAVVERAAAIGEWLGKGIVYGKDTTNFVANRIGVYGMMLVIKMLESEGLSVEAIDKITGKPMGRPKSASFGTADLVGLDTFIHVAQNCYDALAKDEEREIFKIPEWLTRMVKEGRLGRKSGAGFYKKVGDEILSLDVKSLDYKKQEKVRFDSLGSVKEVADVGERLKILVNSDDPAGRFAWKALSRTLAYSARRLGEICDDIVQIDNALKWGFNWDLGPFEAWDAIGVGESVARMQKEGVALPKWVVAMLEGGRSTFYDGTPAKRRYFEPTKKEARPLPHNPKHLSLAKLHDQKRVLKDNMGASLVDLGDGVLCVEVHTKMNTVDDDVLGMLNEGVALAEKDFDAMVIGNDGEHFGAGANLMLIYMAAQNKAWDEIDRVVRLFQSTVQNLRYAKVPVVAAPFQYTFGGAAEIAMACDACQAYAETYMGLVEVGVGVVPAGGGCLRMVERYTGPVQDIEGADLLHFAGQASLTIALAKVSTSADEARRLRYLMPSDGISLNRDELLSHAKERALGLARAGYRPPRPRLLRAAGFDTERTITMRILGMVEGGYASEHDALVARKVARIVCGGSVPAGTERKEQDYLDSEREAFLSLCGEEKSQARMQSILMYNKPLRN